MKLASLFEKFPINISTRFPIRTDHDALRWLLNMTDVTGTLAQWRLRLSELELDVVHRAVIKRQAADSLSRLETTDPDTSKMNDYMPTYFFEKVQ